MNPTAGNDKNTTSNAGASRKRIYPNLSSGTASVRQRPSHPDSSLPHTMTQPSQQLIPVPSPTSTSLFNELATLEIGQILSLDNNQLKQIYNDAPPAVQLRFQLKASAPLETVLEMRDAARSASTDPEKCNELSPNESFEKLMNMPPPELVQLATEKPGDLQHLLVSGMKARNHLPDLRDLAVESTAMRNLATVISWKYNAVNNLLELEEEKNQRMKLEVDALRKNTPAIIPSPDPPSSTAPILVSNSATHIGGVPIATPPSTPIEGLDFQLGRRSAVRLPSQLPSYPTHGTSTILLAVPEIIGPSILYNFIKHGLTVEAYVRTRPYWQSASHPEQIELEALMLARIIHITLMQYPSPTSALLSCPWMEVALRRLYTVLKVEETHARNPQYTRATIWEGYKPSLETQRDEGMVVPLLENSRIQHLAAETRTNAAMHRMSTPARTPSHAPAHHRRRTRHQRFAPEKAKDSKDIFPSP